MNKYLIVGLGNVGEEFKNTRHNIGFEVIDFVTKKYEIKMDEVKLGKKGLFNYRGKKYVLLKPSTFMNRSGKSVRYWALKENISIKNILIITDDLNLPLGSIRLKTKGTDGGHNGLKDIEAQLNTIHYPRLRFGIKNNEITYNQAEYVLGKFSSEEIVVKENLIKKCSKIIFSFAQVGIDKTMNLFNN
tara:strand:- start:350 stop:913 length:564 start_codon:yes stop_codon:yes gene_type:complete